MAEPDGGPPEFVLDTEGNQVAVTWPEGRPEAVLVTADMLEEWVADRNRMTALIAARGDLIGVLRLGRRPNRNQWLAAGMRPADAPARIEPERRLHVEDS